jgi:MoaA/NifB/PqqE/SkfB family radical SAM enzyme
MKSFLNYINSQKLYETIKNPNFSIVVPGGCNAHCEFCFWKKTKPTNNYLNKLTETMNSLPSQFYQLSLTGGEPTVSPYFKDILEKIDNSKFRHTVLTTNGTNILNYIDIISEKIKFVNISRHHWDDSINESIFKTKTVPNKLKLKTICKKLQENGVDVTLSVVLTEHFKSKKDTDKFINFANDIGVKNVFFRKPHGPNIDKTNIEKEYDNYEYIYESNCPVCRTNTQNINGTFVSWKSSLEEPSNKLGYIYETIFNENGTLTSDWELKNIINSKKIKDNSEILLEGCGGYVSGCGSNSRNPQRNVSTSCGGYVSGCGNNSRNPRRNVSTSSGGYVSGCGSLPDISSCGGYVSGCGSLPDIYGDIDGHVFDDDSSDDNTNNINIEPFEIGDTIYLIDKLQRNLNDDTFDYLVSNDIFEIYDINHNGNVDIGFKKRKNGKIVKVFFNKKRFKKMEPDF